MSGWLISIQKPTTGEIKVVAVAVRDQDGAVRALQSAIAGLAANLTPMKPIEPHLPSFYGVPEGGIKLL
jgi:hypothetical protein